MKYLAACFLMILLPCVALSQVQDAAEEIVAAAEPNINSPIYPPAREANLPRTRWDSIPGTAIWTRTLLSGLKGHASVLPEMVPADIENWCPAYPTASLEKRRAFWAGFISTLVKHESTYKPYAVGGGGKWYGLTQILPATARGYKCRARSGDALKHAPSNLSCALRIMAYTVPRDGVVSYGMRGVAADWGPLHSRKKRHDMMAWTKRQTYCKPLGSTRPQARPAAFKTAMAE